MNSHMFYVHLADIAFIGIIICYIAALILVVAVSCFIWRCLITPLYENYVAWQYRRKYGSNYPQSKYHNYRRYIK